MKNLTGVIVGVLVVVLVIFGVLAYQRNNNNGNNGMTESGGNSGGNLYIGVTDATADMRNVNDVNLSMEKVELHSPTEGWVAVSSNGKTYGLVSLKNAQKTELYAKEENVRVGSFDKVRVTLRGAEIDTKSKGKVSAQLPSSQIVMNSFVNIKEGEDTFLKLDFIADKSLHSTADGQYVFAPVVKGESRSGAMVTTDSNGAVSVSSGSVDSSTSVGVDLDGSSRSNFSLQTDDTLKVEVTGTQVNFILGGKTYVKDNSKVQENELKAGTEVNLNLQSGTSANTNNTNAAGSTSGGVNINGGAKVNY